MAKDGVKKETVARRPAGVMTRSESSAIRPSLRMGWPFAYENGKKFFMRLVGRSSRPASLILEQNMGYSYIAYQYVVFIPGSGFYLTDVQGIN